VLIQLVRLEAEQCWRELRNSHPIDQSVTFNELINEMRDPLDRLERLQRDSKPEARDAKEDVGKQSQGKNTESENAVAVEAVEQQLTSLNMRDAKQESDQGGKKTNIREIRDKLRKEAEAQGIRYVHTCLLVRTNSSGGRAEVRRFIKRQASK
jgi:hypothetical protein